MKTHVTLADVAERAGVSRSAASKALLGGGGKTTKISDATKQKILAAAEELHYSPNSTAQFLRSGKSTLIGLLLTGTQDRFYNQLMTELAEELLKYGYTTIASFFHDVPGLEQAYETILRYRPAGIISCHADFQYSGQIPTVIFGDRNEHLDSLYYDVMERYTLILDYLESLGIRNAATAGSMPRLLPLLKQRNILCRKEWQFNGLGQYATGVEAARQLLKSKELPEVVIAINDVVAISLLAELQANGIRVPQDISVIGCDNIEESKHVTPRLTTIYADIKTLAVKLAAMLMERIHSAEAPVRNEKIDYDLMERKSCRSRKGE